MRSHDFISKTIAMVLVSTGLALAGCGGDKTTGPGGNNAGDHISFSLDGDNVAMTLGATGIPPQEGVIGIGAHSAANTSDNILLTVPETKSTAPVNNSGGMVVTLSIGGAQYISNGVSGSVTVSNVSATRVSGTFSCTLMLLSNPAVTKTIAGGTFDVPITQ